MDERKNGILSRGSCMKIRSLKSLRKITISQSTQQNYVSSAKPGEDLQPVLRNVMRFYKNTVKSPKKLFEQKYLYCRDTHKTDISYQPYLFKVNRITHEERLINF